MDPPSGTYDEFPKVTVLGTVQYSELVRIPCVIVSHSGSKKRTTETKLHSLPVTS